MKALRTASSGFFRASTSSTTTTTSSSSSTPTCVRFRLLMAKAQRDLELAADVDVAVWAAIAAPATHRIRAYRGEREVVDRRIRWQRAEEAGGEGGGCLPQLAIVLLSAVRLQLLPAAE
jgi:hypothetical protein